MDHTQSFHSPLTPVVKRISPFSRHIDWIQSCLSWISSIRKPQCCSPMSQKRKMEKRPFTQTLQWRVPHTSMRKQTHASAESAHFAFCRRHSSCSWSLSGTESIVSLASSKRLLQPLTPRPVGNAAILGLPQELELRGSQFQVATLILFIPFILLEVPSNIIMKKTRPYLWLSVLMVGCGERSTECFDEQGCNN